MLVQGKKGIITTPHQAASEAGARILSQGGNAIDAMISASAVLSIVFPHMTGIGGDALWVIFDKKVRSIMGLGQAGQNKPEQAISERGPTALALTSAALASWQTALNISQHHWGSRCKLEQLLEESIDLAQRGVRVSPSHAFWIQQRKTLLETLPSLNPLTRNRQGEALVAGDIFYQRALGDTLAVLAKNGLMDFYCGEVAQELSNGFNQLGSQLTLDDFKAVRAEEITPLSVRYRQGTYYNFPPPSQGLYTLQALATLQRFSLSNLDPGGSQYYHLLVEAVKQALKERNHTLHDPLADAWDFASVLAPRNIDSATAAEWNETGKPADTIWMAATDAQGRTACLMQSLFHDFGSGCIIGDSGVLWHNRAAGFNANQNHINAWAPGKRPAHTLNPSCYIADDGTQLFFGSQGGDGQPQTQMVLATQLVDYQKEIDEALFAPRFLLGRSFFDSTENLKLEASMHENTITALLGLGHEIERIPALSPYCGQAGIIKIDALGNQKAMHDPRGQGVSIAIN
ncbi:Putative gamma-glutamyltransferase YwrD [Thalassocella blandensis]|nr:Putative gamma-glutamyltransferase YwrD [Thalassocella blandensis]